MLLLLAACASSGPNAPKSSSWFAAPDWAKDSSGPTFSTTAPTGQALVGADGRCLVGDPTGAEIVAGGIALDMSECDVVRRAGPVDNVEIGTSPRGERSTTLTYMRGERPGIYRFLNGRLVSVERGPEPPPPPKPEKPKKKPAKKSGKTVASGQ